MRTVSAALLVLTAGFGWAFVPLPRVLKEEPSRRKAERIVRRWAVALAAKDIDGLVACSDLPFHVGDLRVLDEPAELREHFKTLVATGVPPGAKLISYKTLRVTHHKDFCNPDFVESLRRIVGEDGWVVEFRLNDRLYPVFVRIHDAGAAVVGYFTS
ncbi:MAG: hypothetical protein U0793_15685 [Gemmataceae bacterium]